MMKRLALRSVYWTGMSEDIINFSNECRHCQDMMRRNKEPEKLPEEETRRPYESISMDIFKSEAGEHGIAIIDRHTGFIWCRKTGNTETGTALKIRYILDETMGPNIYSISKMKTDNGSNLVGGAIEKLSKDLKIWQDTSSAYHAEGNKLIENTVAG